MTVKKTLAASMLAGAALVGGYLAAPPDDTDQRVEQAQQSAVFMPDIGDATPAEKTEAFDANECAAMSFADATAPSDGHDGEVASAPDTSISPETSVAASASSSSVAIIDSEAFAVASAQSHTNWYDMPIGPEGGRLWSVCIRAKTMAARGLSVDGEYQLYKKLLAEWSAKLDSETEELNKGKSK